MAVPFAVVGLGMEARRVKTCVCMHGLIHDSPTEAFVIAEENPKKVLYLTSYKGKKITQTKQQHPCHRVVG